MTNGYFVMRQDDKIELTSSIADEPGCDAPSELMERRPGTSTDQPPQSIHNHPYTDKELDAVVGLDGGGGWYWGEDWNKEVTFGPQDDPTEVVSAVLLARITENLWQQGDIKPEEIPEGLQDEIKESGAIAVTLRDVRNSLGKDRQQWHLALESELQSLRDTGAIETVTQVLRGKQILPMKVALTLKPVPGLTKKRRKPGYASVVTSSRRNLRIYSIPPTPMLAAFELSWLKQHSIWTMA